jgi:hypothetical protein
VILTIQFFVSLTAVFLKGFQHQNVIGGKYKMAAVFSYAMATLDVAVIALVVQSGWSSIIPVGTGGAIGIVASMYLYRRISKRRQHEN